MPFILIVKRRTTTLAAAYHYGPSAPPTITVLANEKIEDEIVGVQSFASEVLEQIEVRSA